MLSMRPSYQSLISVFQHSGAADAGLTHAKRSTPASVLERRRAFEIGFKRVGVYVIPIRRLTQSTASSLGNSRVEPLILLLSICNGGSRALGHFESVASAAARRSRV